MENVINFENMFSFSSEDIFGFLQRTIDEEIQKGNKGMDAVLVDECVLILEQLYGKEIYCPTKDQIYEKYRKLKEKYEKIKDDELFWKDLSCDNDELKAIINGDVSEKPLKHIKFRKTLLIAAIVAASILGLTITGAATGKNIFGDIKFFGFNYKDLPAGSEMTDGKISVYKNDKASVYATIEEMARAKGFEGFYYPESLEFKKINIDEYDGKITITFIISEGGYHFSLIAVSYDEYGIQNDIPAYTKETLKNGTEVFCYEMKDGKYQLMFKMGNWYYCLVTENYDEGIKTIETFKEATP
ncbi:MAG: DUF4367 domain-containing protein [Ruminococcaceae bacterium]|nr:DUF4367 domain-containing protein [Oscillospiraceae bacterium]